MGKNALVQDAHPAVVAAAENGPHKGWSYFDSKLEGARFHLLQAIVERDPFDAPEAERLLDELDSLAQSYGYGQTDSYLTDAAGKSDEEIEADAPLAVQRGNLFDDEGEEDLYFIDVRGSELILFKGAATDEAKDFLGAAGHAEGWKGAWGTIHSRMKEAFLRGRDMRAAQDFSGPSAPPPSC